MLLFLLALNLLNGLSGTNCEIDIDECETMPCQNNATCVDEINNFTCFCPAGFTGRLCETNIDECQVSDMFYPYLESFKPPRVISMAKSHANH